MTIPEKQTEISNLIAILKAEGMMYPVGDNMDAVLVDCRRLVKVVRRCDPPLEGIDAIQALSYNPENYPHCMDVESAHG